MLIPIVALALLLPQQGLEVFRSLMPPAAERPPARLVINGEAFEVGMLEPEHMAGNDGITFCDRHLILLNVAQPDAMMRSSLTHEILHAITCKDGGKAKKYNSKSEKAHEGIYYLAPKLASVLENNPNLLIWMDYRNTRRKKDALAEQSSLGTQ